MSWHIHSEFETTLLSMQVKQLLLFGPLQVKQLFEHT